LKKKIPFCVFGYGSEHITLTKTKPIHLKVGLLPTDGAFGQMPKGLGKCRLGR